MDLDNDGANSNTEKFHWFKIYRPPFIPTTKMDVTHPPSRARQVTNQSSFARHPDRGQATNLLAVYGVNENFCSLHIKINCCPVIF
jgi:hypothetical protein